MTWVILALIPVALAISAPLCAGLVWLGHRWQTFDSGGVQGQIKDRSRRVPNTGGIAIFWAIVLPIVGVVAASLIFGSLPGPADDAVSFVISKAPLAAVLLACLLTLHLLGVVDDRRPLPAIPKLVLMIAPALAAPLLTDTRLLTALDTFAGGPWLSIVLTAIWFVAITNAVNFLDNMDGLAGGITLIAASVLLVVTIEKSQWLLAGCLALAIGACAGFLLFNAPLPGRSGARLFMGDGGSLVLGFLLAFVTVRVTYFDPRVPQASHLHALALPLCVLAVPIYDCVVVTCIRLWNGRSPLVGDMNHASHRLVRRGLSRTAAVYVLWGLTALTAGAGWLLARADGWAAWTIAGAMVIALAGVAITEWVLPAPQPTNGRAAREESR